MRAMVLAAGVGSRLDPLTTQIPKPLVPVANVPVMEHMLNLLKKNQVFEVVSNLHHLPDKLTQYFGDGSQLGMNLTYHYEKELSGDAGGVRACREFLQGGTFIVLMGDLLTDADLTAIVAEHKRKGALATIGIKRVDDVSQFGVVLTDENGFITGFQEKPRPEEALSDLASTGIYVFEPEVFDHIPARGTYGFGRQLFPRLVEQGAPILGSEITRYWSDVGTIKQYRTSNFDALDGAVSVDMPGTKTDFGWLGTNSHIADNCQIEGRLLVGNNSRIAKGVKIRGSVIIGDDCFIDQNAELEDSIIWSDVSVESGARLKQSVIGFNCVVNGTKPLLEAAVVS
jgi:mannose-1-phosphate guanylyltransferase